MSNQGRLEHAFTVAEQHLQVQKLLEPSGNRITYLFQSESGAGFFEAGIQFVIETTKLKFRTINI